MAGATSYNLYWSTSASVTPATGAKIAGAHFPYVHAGRAAGTPLYYVVAAVNGSGESAASAQASATPNFVVTGNVVLGPPVKGATVTLYALNANGTPGPAMGSPATSDALGGYSIALAAAPTSPVRAVAAGGSYVDEVTGAAVTLTPSDTLSAVIPVGAYQVAITPLTSMAAARAQALAGAGAALATAATAANAGVGRQFAIPDVLAVMPSPANNALQQQLAATDARAYGLVLAGIAQEAQLLGVRDVDLAAALARDMSDGVFDGHQGVGAITIPNTAQSLSASAGTSSLQSAINTFSASPLNQTHLSGQTVAGTSPGIGVAGGGFYVSGSGLPAWVSGRAASALLGAAGGTPPYACSAPGLPGWLTVSGGATGCTFSGTAPLLSGGTTRSLWAPVTVTVTDSAGPPASQAAVIIPTVIKAAPTLTLVNPAPAATVGQAYSQSLVASVSGGTSPYNLRSDTFANGAPPLGMIVNLNGSLVGTPSMPGTYSFSMCAVDLVGMSVCAQTSITVNVNPDPTPVSVATYVGAFSGSGSFNRPFSSTTCTFYNTFTGNVTLTVTQTGAVTTGDAHVQGNWVSKATAGSTANFTCLDSSTPWEDDQPATISGLNVTWSTGFTTPAGSNVTGAFTGSTGAAAVTGTLLATVDTSTGSASIPVALAKQ